MISVGKIPSVTSEKFASFDNVIYERLLLLRLKVRGRSDGRHPQSQQWTVQCRQTVFTSLTYLQYNYLDFFVTPVVAGLAGTGKGWGDVREYL